MCQNLSRPHVRSITTRRTRDDQVAIRIGQMIYEDNHPFFTPPYIFRRKKGRLSFRRVCKKNAAKTELEEKRRPNESDIFFLGYLAQTKLCTLTLDTYILWSTERALLFI